MRWQRKRYFIRTLFQSRLVNLWCYSKPCYLCPQRLSCPVAINGQSLFPVGGKCSWMLSSLPSVNLGDRAPGNDPKPGPPCLSHRTFLGLKLWLLCYRLIFSHPQKLHPNLWFLLNLHGPLSFKEKQWLWLAMDLASTYLRKQNGTGIVK